MKNELLLYGKVFSLELFSSFFFIALKRSSLLPAWIPWYLLILRILWENGANLLERQIQTTSLLKPRQTGVDNSKLLTAICISSLLANDIPGSTQLNDWTDSDLCHYWPSSPTLAFSWSSVFGCSSFSLKTPNLKILCFRLLFLIQGKCWKWEPGGCLYYPRWGTLLFFSEYPLSSSSYSLTQQGLAEG